MLSYDQQSQTVNTGAPVKTPEPEEDDGLFSYASLFGNDFMQSVVGGDVCLEDEAPICGDVETESLDAEDGLCEDTSLSADLSEVAAEELTCGPDNPEERIAAAEAARAGLNDRLGELADLPAEQRDRILTRVNGLEGDALATEMETIHNALNGPNGDRALNTLADIQARIDEDPDVAARLTPEVTAMLVNGVANSRTTSDRGQEGVLTRLSAQRGADAVLNMSDEQYAQLTETLNQAGRDADGNAVEGADAGAEQALILKAVSAREDTLNPGFFGGMWNGIVSFFGGETSADRSMNDIAQFGADIRGMKRDDLIRQTTLIDIDDVNTSTTNPDSIMANNDTAVDNDGLYQRFGDSCAPTSAQMLRGEADPMYALRVHRDGLTDPAADTETGEEQRRVLEDVGGGTAISRLGTQATGDLTSHMDRLQGEGNLSDADRDLITRYSRGEDMGDQSAASEAALERMRAANGGRPTVEEVAAMRFNRGRTRGGGMDYSKALDDITQPATDTDYEHHGFTGGNIANDLSNIDERLKNGEDVPFRIGWNGGGGHAMSITDVRSNADGTRRYLMSDPWTGATRWVSQADLTSGNINHVFGIGNGTITHSLVDPTKTTN